MVSKERRSVICCSTFAALPHFYTVENASTFHYNYSEKFTIIMSYIVCHSLYVLHWFSFTITSCIGCHSLYVLHWLSFTICPTLVLIHYMSYIGSHSLYVLHWLSFTICPILVFIHYMSYIGSNSLLWPALVLL